VLEGGLASTYASFEVVLFYFLVIFFGFFGADFVDEFDKADFADELDGA
jgi:hypothetical protein